MFQWFYSYGMVCREAFMPTTEYWPTWTEAGAYIASINANDPMPALKPGELLGGFANQYYKNIYCRLTDADLRAK